MVSSEQLTDALTDLKALEADSEFGIEVVRICKPKKQSEPLLVDVSIDCSSLVHTSKGLKLRSRERFWLCFSPDFPLDPPTVFAPDRRFAFHDHVYWMDALGVNLCVYYSTEQQWQPALGVTGFVHRFMQWLEDAVGGTLDRQDQPFHPPQVLGDLAKQFFVVRADCPDFNAAWLGYAVLEPKLENRIDLVDWTQDWSVHRNRTLAPTILVDTPFVSEFPKHVSSLLILLERVGVDTGALANLLLVHAQHSKGRPPMFLVLGVAMRGTIGQQANQHLVVWRIGDRDANDLRNLVRRRKKYSEKSAKATFNRGTTLIEQWKESPRRLTFCTVYEDRPEIVTRRDNKSKVAWFNGKTVTLWGVGALGSPIAEHLVRAGLTELRLVDSQRVTPGLLVRQNYRDTDIGKSKVEALKQHLMAINPKLRVVSFPNNLLSAGEWFDQSLVDTDALIDATASRRVAMVIDRLLRDKGPLRHPVVTVANDLHAEMGIFTVTPADNSLGPTDLLHRAFLALNNAEANDYLDAFWPIADESIWFEPEPGCSSPTFRGSNADAGALAGSMLAHVGQELSTTSSSLVICGRTTAIDDVPGYRFEFATGSQHTCPDTGYQVRFFPEAEASMLDIIGAEQQGGQDPRETGGVLYGYKDDFLRVMWVVAASPPPLDSRRAQYEFVCGVEGVAEETADWQQRSSKLVGFLGTWHSHPVSSAVPSVVDLGAMEHLLRQSGSPRHRLLLVVVGHSASKPLVGSYVFGGQSEDSITHNGNPL